MSGYDVVDIVYQLLVPSLCHLLDRPFLLFINRPVAAPAVEVGSDGSRWLWGANELGLFVDCTTKTHNKPVQVGIGFVHAAVGAQFLSP
ncbi:hypothetical protein QFZ41_001311 [Luteibacter sp. W1I16]|uniref:hypothetical protein n=1 Tax=Luteibacter sp. W1I16 TaxID=3373922 RepID=UPI003D21FA7A